ncbi:hypothetical protein Hanom_Chr04g00377741 [Helianthus anomalus]
MWLYHFYPFSPKRKTFTSEPSTSFFLTLLARKDVPTTVTPDVVVKVDYSAVASPVAFPICAEPSPARRHDKGIIGKRSPHIQVEPTPPVFALHLDAAENNEESGNRTWVTGYTNSFPNHSTTTSLVMKIKVL